MIFSPKIKKSGIFRNDSLRIVIDTKKIGFWAIFAGPRGIFAKLPKILTLLLKLHTQKNDLQLFACASHNFWPRIKNPWCYENLQVISTRLYQLIWILLFYGAIFKTNKMKQNFEKKKHYKNCYSSNFTSEQNLTYLWLYESH